MLVRCARLDQFSKKFEEDDREARLEASVEHEVEQGQFDESLEVPRSDGDLTQHFIIEVV